MTKNRDCGRCKCYVCGYGNCMKSLCRGNNPLDDCKETEHCGRFVFDAEKLRDVLIPPEKSSVI